MPLFLTFCEQAEQKKNHARRDSNPQPPDSKSDALSIAPRAQNESWNKAGGPRPGAKRSQSKKCTLVVHTSLFKIFEHMREIIFSKVLASKKKFPDRELNPGLSGESRLS